MAAIAKSGGGRARAPVSREIAPDGAAYLSSAQLGGLLAADKRAGPAAAAPPGNLFTLPGMPAATTTSAASINFVANTIIAQNEVYYSPSAGTFLYLDHNPTVLRDISLTNHGWIWNEGDTTGALAVRGESIGRIDNRGTIVAFSGQAHAKGVRADTSGGITNSGAIYAVSTAATGGTSTGIEAWAGNIAIENSGLIGVRDAGGRAIGVTAGNGGSIFNAATGSILVEGPTAFGVEIVDGNSSLAAPEVRNEGRIEAVSTNAGLAIGVLLHNLASQPLYVVNSGLIRADIAIYGNSYALSEPVFGQEIIVNQAPGRIIGLIFLDLGLDIVENAGLIQGDILMGLNEDRITNSGRIEGFVDFGMHDDIFDTAAGVFVGIADMGWGRDRYTGGAQSDVALGNRHADVMTGGGGDDLLLGGFGDDRLEGGAGNDGLFGEYGHDTILTQSGDYVSAGAGDDRIEAGDLAFELVDGGAGFDILVLPAGARIFDLAAALAEQGLAGIEAIQLRGSQELVVRAADVPLLAGGAHRLFVAATATDQVDLIGSWTAAGIESLNGLSYRAYVQGSETVLVQTGAAVTIGQPAPAGATGLDPFPGGALAPLPDSDMLVPQVTIMNDFYFYNSWGEVIEADEIWRSDENAQRGVVLVEGSSSSFTNYGRLESFSDSHQVFTAEIGAETLWNFGTISATAGGAFGGRALFARGGVLHNDGLILADGAFATGMTMTYFEYDDRRPIFFNDGDIVAHARDILATGVIFTVETFYNSARFEGSNSGRISATLDGHGTATGIELSYALVGRFTNTGLIEAAAGAVTGTGVSTHSYGMSVGGYVSTFTLTNSGTIHAEVAVRFSLPGQFTATDFSDAVLINSGRLEGRVEFDSGDDLVTNSGTITGKVTLGGGRDRYDGSGGSQSAGVHGGDGDDVLIGGAGADILTGGTGSDRLTGGGGADTFVFASAGEGPLPALRSDGKKFLADLVTDFQTGIDRIDLSAIDAIAGTAGNDAFTFIGTNAFTGHAGELRYDAGPGPIQILADVDGDGFADFQIAAIASSLQAADFIL